MAKIEFFSEDTMKTVGKLMETENGRAVIDYGKGNFLMGGLTTVAFVVTGYTVYKAIKFGALVVEYLKS